MNPKTIGLSLAFAALLLASGTASAATSGQANITVAVSELQAKVVKITQTETDISGSGDDGRIISATGTGAAKRVTYNLFFFDRNGELDLAGDHDIRLSLFGPAANGAPQLTNPLIVGDDKVGIAMTGCPGLTQTTTAVFKGDPTSNGVALNGVLNCQVQLTFNNGDVSSRSGEYTLVADVLNEGGSTVQHSMSIVTVVYDLLDILVRVVDGATGAEIVGGSLDFGTKSLGTGFTATTAANRLEVLNEASSSFGVSFTFSDLTGPAGTINSVDRTAFRVKDSISASSTWTDPGSASAGTSVPANGIVAPSGTVAEGQAGRYSLYLGDITTEGQLNEILQDGNYAGDIQVAVSVDGGASPYVHDGDASYTPAPVGNLAPAALDNPDTLGVITIA